MANYTKPVSPPLRFLLRSPSRCGFLAHTSMCYEPPRHRLDITDDHSHFPFRMSARVGVSSARVSSWVVRCLFWLCDVYFGCAMGRLGFSFGVLPSHSLVFSAAVPSALCLFHLFFLFGSPCFLVAHSVEDILACLYKGPFLPCSLVSLSNTFWLDPYFELSLRLTTYLTVCLATSVTPALDLILSPGRAVTATSHAARGPFVTACRHG